MKDKLKVTGRLQIALNGVVVEDTSNLVVTSGLEYIADAFGTGSSTAMLYMGVGTGGTGEVLANTVLETAISGLDTTGFGGLQTLDGTDTAGAATVVYTASWAAGEATGALEEAGIFNAFSGGGTTEVGAPEMLSRTTFDVINKGASDTLAITWTITVA
jgi:hypothetical protein